MLAPTTIAFEYLGAGVVETLSAPANAALLARILRHHIVPGRLAPEDFTDGRTLTTLDGRTLTVRRTGPVVQVDGVTLDVTDAVDAEGSIAYPLADVLLGAVTARERVEISRSLSRFRGLAQGVGLFERADDVGEVTVLAPLDDAFVALGSVEGRLFGLPSTADVRARVLPFHVVAGTPPLADGATWTSLDGDPLAVRVEGGVTTVGGQRVLRVEPTANGRIVVLGGVILDPLSIAQRLRIEPSVLLYWQELRDRLPTVWNRLQDDDDELTVFAPTDVAYTGRGADVNNALSDVRNAALNERVLRVHVVEGRVTPADLVDGRQLVALDGTVLTVRRSGQAVTLDGRRIDPAGRRTSNGTLYTTGVFIFPAVDGFDTAILRGYTAHAAAVRRAGLEAQFRAPGVTAFLASNDLYGSDPRPPAEQPPAVPALQRDRRHAPNPRPRHVRGARRPHARDPIRLVRRDARRPLLQPLRAQRRDAGLPGVAVRRRHEHPSLPAVAELPAGLLAPVRRAPP